MLSVTFFIVSLNAAVLIVVRLSVLAPNLVSLSLMIQN
jgi:hypothetical protein